MKTAISLYILLPKSIIFKIVVKKMMSRKANTAGNSVSNNCAVAAYNE
jgi:hypothetical protein